MLRHAAKSTARHIAIGTEVGLLHRLETQQPNMEFPTVTESSCSNMKRTALTTWYEPSKKETPHHVPEGVRKEAKKALDKTLEIGAQGR